MAVDLSRVGLEGIETGQRTLNAIAQRQALASQTAIAESEEQRTVKAEQLEQQALDRTMSIMAGRGVDLSSPDVTADDLGTFQILAGQQLLSAGAGKRGSEMIAAGMDYISKDKELQGKEFEQQGKRLENMKKASTFMYEALADSMNENEFQFNMANLPQDIVDILGPENVETLKNTPYSVELIDFFKQKALSVKDQADFELRAQNAQRAQEKADRAAAIAQGALDLGWQRHKEAVRARQVQEKAQGATGVSKAPTTDERKSARAAIAANVPGITFGAKAEDDDILITSAVDDVVSEAKRLVDQNRGTTFGEAVNQAVLTMKSRGEFVPIVTEKKWFSPDVTETKYMNGKTPERAIPLPKDKSKMVRGRYYTANGKTLQYGTDFE